MKILEVSRSFYPSVGGLEKFVFDRLHLYNSLGIDYKLITTDYNTGRFDYSIQEGKKNVFKQFTPYGIIPFLKNKIDIQGFDLISVNQIGNHLSDFILLNAIKKKKKTILTPHIYFHTSKHNFFKKIHRKFISPHLLHNVNKIICFTNFEKMFLAEQFQLPERVFYVAPHYFSANVDTSNIDFEPFILYLGRVSKNKRIDLIVKAFNSLIDYPYNLYLTAHQKELGSDLLLNIAKNKRIKLLGYISENQKVELLKKTSALMLASDFEAFGIVLLEASYFRKPILCSNLPVFNEILSPKGVLYFNNSVNDIADAFTKFSKFSKNDLLKMGEENKDNLNRYDFAIIQQHYKTLINSLI